MKIAREPIVSYLCLLAFLVCGCSSEPEKKEALSARVAASDTDRSKEALYQRALASVGELETAAAYNDFTFVVDNYPNQDIQLQARVLKIVTAAAEIAAYNQIYEIYLSSGKVSFAPILSRIRKEQFDWGNRLFQDTSQIETIVENRVWIAMHQLLNSNEIVAAANGFNATKDKITRGAVPSERDQILFEGVGRYIFLSTTIGRTLAVSPVSGKFGFLAVWKDGNLKGEVQWDQIVTLAAVSMLGAANVSENREKGDPRRLYTRAAELAEIGLAIIDENRKPEIAKTLRDLQSYAEGKKEIRSDWR